MISAIELGRLSGVVTRQVTVATAHSTSSRYGPANVTSSLFDCCGKSHASLTSQ